MRFLLALWLRLKSSNSKCWSKSMLVGWWILRKSGGLLTMWFLVVFCGSTLFLCWLKHQARWIGTDIRHISAPTKTSYARNGHQVVQNVGVEHLYFPSISLPARWRPLDFNKCATPSSFLPSLAAIAPVFFLHCGVRAGHHIASSGCCGARLDLNARKNARRNVRIDAR